MLLYVDPGSSSYLIQALVAAAMGGAYVVKTYWWKFKSLFRKKEEVKEK